MSLIAVARKDFADARRSKALLALAVLFVALGMGGTYLYTILPSMDPSIGPVTETGLYTFLSQITGLFIALGALVVSYKAIAGETESGSGKLLLGLPHTRADVFVGKVVGRAGVMLAALVVGLVATLAIATVVLGNIGVTSFLVFLGVTLVFGLVYVSLMVSVSASTTSTSRAATLAIGVFVVLELFWDAVVFVVVFVANGFAAPAGQMPTWALALNGFSPSIAYQTAVGWLLGWTSGAGMAVPFHQQAWFALLVLVVWAVVPALIGFHRYNQADL